MSPQQLLQTFASKLRQTKQNPGIEAYKPFPHQEKVHRSKAQGKMVMGGNRAGKTVTGGAEAVMRLTGKHPFRDDLPKPPVRGRAIGVDFKGGINQIIIPEIKKWMPAKELINGSWEDSYSKEDKTLYLKNGSSLEFMSYEQLREKFQGTSRHFVWFDEEPSEDIFDENMARLIDTDGDYWITMTPLIEMSWTYDALYEPAKAGELVSVDVFEIETFDNPHINQDAFNRLTQTQSEEQIQTRKTGVYISHTGLVYGETFSRTRNVIPDIVSSSRFNILLNKDETQINKQWTHFQMMDHGYTNPTAWLFGCYDVDGRIIIYDMLYGTKTIVSEWARLVLERRDRLGIETSYAVGDPAITSTDPITGTSIQTEYAENGVFIGLGNNDVTSGIVRTQEMFKHNQLIIGERCIDLLKELNKYRWDRHLTKARDRKNLKEVPVKKDDHACDALRYGIMSRPKAYDVVDNKKLNVLNANRVASDFDWSLVAQNDQTIDAYLGTEV